MLTNPFPLSLSGLASNGMVNFRAQVLSGHAWAYESRRPGDAAGVLQSGGGISRSKTKILLPSVVLVSREIAGDSVNHILGKIIVPKSFTCIWAYLISEN